MIDSHVRMMRWGTTERNIPSLRTSDNGWYYDFDGKSVGRGPDGARNANAVMLTRRRNIHEEFGWELPDEVEPKLSDMVTESNGLSVGFDHSSIGWVTVTFSPANRTLRLMGHPVLYEIMHRQVTDLSYAAQTTIYSADVNRVWTTDHIAKEMWNIALAKWPEAFQILGIDLESQIELKWQANHRLQQDNPILLTWASAASYWSTLDKKAVELAMSERFDDLRALFKVLGFDNVRLTTAYMPGTYKSMVAGIEVSGKDPDQDLPHTVTFTTSGARVKCGFVEDEKRYLEAEKRKIAGWISEFGEEFSEIEL